MFYDQGDSELSVIGRQLDAFLKQVSYVRDGDTVHMKSLLEEEVEEIDAFLSAYREAKEKNKHIYMEALTPEEFDAVDEFLYDYREKKMMVCKKLTAAAEIDGQISMFDK